MRAPDFVGIRRYHKLALLLRLFVVNEFYKKGCSIKRDVKKKVLPRPEGEKILSRDPAHFTVRVPLDLRERVFASELSSIPVAFIVRW